MVAAAAVAAVAAAVAAVAAAVAAVVAAAVESSHDHLDCLGHPCPPQQALIKIPLCFGLAAC